ncbi:C-type lectin domain family 2 member H-like [Anas acuta]|uniref:C-type lectin domain family 2 member H-like n=1 Tax=Anas acuta TaxID=28680 RepID=UPI0035C8CF42
MAVALPVEEHNNEDNDSVTESTRSEAGMKQWVLGLLTKCKVRVAARKLCVFFGAVIVVLISVIIWLSQRPCSCPRLWIGFKGKCFYFSDMEKNQTWSRADCHERGANLAVIQSKEELEFVLHYKGSHDHWIGLSRQNPRQRWVWDDGTEFDSSLFPIGGGEHFAFLNNQRVTSARSSGERHWICTRQP